MGAGQVLDAAGVGKDIGTLVALILLQAEGDGDAALAILADIDGLAPPESLDELDAPPIATQAIREAMAMRGEDPAPKSEGGNG